MKARNAILLFAAPFAFSSCVFAGEASGEFVAGKRPPIKPRYAAAFETRDQRDGRKRIVEVVLSEEPVDVSAAVAELDPHANVINQKALSEHNYVLLWVRPGNDVSMNATYAATMTQFVEMTSDRMKAELTANTMDRVAGRIFSPKSLKMDAEAYSIDLTFSTAVTHAPAGVRLPAGGGEPAQAFRALQAAIAKNDWEGIKRNVTAKNLESFNDADRTAKENLDDAVQTLGLWLPKKSGKVTGGELRGDIAILELQSEVFEGQDGLFLIRMIKNGLWQFDRATRAGLIDK
ncbi:MAG: hypothetical protein QOK37_4049 [Thermoanaerobaculia bacterium]|nr:hypothetical protein [Thermoanaerobaculia bacterium]